MTLAEAQDAFLALYDRARDYRRDRAPDAEEIGFQIWWAQATPRSATGAALRYARRRFGRRR